MGYKTSREVAMATLRAGSTSACRPTRHYHIDKSVENYLHYFILKSPKVYNWWEGCRKTAIIRKTVRQKWIGNNQLECSVKQNIMQDTNETSERPMRCLVGQVVSGSRLLTTSTQV